MTQDPDQDEVISKYSKFYHERLQFGLFELKK